MSSHPAKPAMNTGRNPVSATQPRDQMIAVAAYYRSERRGFNEGDPVADWLEAEAEIDRMLRGEHQRGTAVGAKQSFQKMLEGQLKDWDAKLAELKAKAKESKLKTRGELEKQLDAIAGNRAVVEQKLRELRRRSEDTWEDMKDSTLKAWEDMKESLEQAVARFK